MSADAFFGGSPGLSWPRADRVNGADGKPTGVYLDTRLRGVSRGGVIVDEPQLMPMTEMGTGVPLKWPDGRPKQQMVVTLICDGRGGKALDERDPQNPADTGRRRLYIRGYMVAAVREALQKAGTPGMLRQGGELYVAWIDEKPSKTASFDPARIWAAQYSPPAVGLPDGGAQSQPQHGLSGQPAGNPFGGPTQQPAIPQQPTQGQQPAPQQPAAQPANPFGGQVTGPPAQEPAGYDPNQYRQQPAPTGGPPANPFG